ncbi:MAG: hypothetical protein WDZ85_03185 [Candidatus Paceibacterota bacterium]
MANKTTKATQDFTSIKEIRDQVVILNDGSFRAVMIASSLNFSLKSSDEQTAIIMQYQNFLNSLDFDIQIFIQSRKLDIRPYLKLIEERLKNQTNDLIKIQTREYMEFIKSFTQSTKVMTKNFFIVIPYSPPIFQDRNSLWAKLPFGRKKDRPKTDQGDDPFEENKIQLEQRMSVIEQGLSRFGVNTAILGTEELVELYFRVFNPGERDVPSAT